MNQRLVEPELTFQVMYSNCMVQLRLMTLKGKGDTARGTAVRNRIQRLEPQSRVLSPPPAYNQGSLTKGSVENMGHHVPPQKGLKQHPQEDVCVLNQQCEMLSKSEAVCSLP